MSGLVASPEASSSSAATPSSSSTGAVPPTPPAAATSERVDEYSSDDEEDFHDDDRDEIQRQDDLLATVNAVESGTSDPQYQRNGHNRRSNAPNNRQSYRRNDRRTYDRTCHLCKEDDHFVRNCPKLQSCLNFLGAGNANGQQ